MTQNPVTPFLQRQGTLILDGGLATELERKGCDLRDELWSARLLADDPAVIRQVHLDYYQAGADCCTSASYQATIPGFVCRGMTPETARELLRLSVGLVVEARDEFWSNESNHFRRLRPIAAAGIGPYGAYLADGSEYNGRYGLDETQLADFHRERWHILAAAGADIMACETIPSFVEARGLASLLAETPGTYAWFSFSCADGEHINDGTPIAECAQYLSDFEQVAAVGINCTPPRFLPDLIRAVTAVTDKPVIVYPNSGETYDPQSKRWVGESAPSEFGTYSREWRKLGAGLIGGCCRTTPDHIRQISDRFRKHPWPTS